LRRLAQPGQSRKGKAGQGDLCVVADIDLLLRTATVGAAARIFTEDITAQCNNTTLRENFNW
jgi:hypothetical protein